MADDAYFTFLEKKKQWEKWQKIQNIDISAYYRAQTTNDWNIHDHFITLIIWALNLLDSESMNLAMSVKYLDSVQVLHEHVKDLESLKC